MSERADYFPVEVGVKMDIGKQKKKDGEGS